MVFRDSSAFPSALLALRRGLAADVAREIKGLQGVILAPARVVPTQPFSPRGDIAKIPSVTLGEAGSERFVEASSVLTPTACAPCQFGIASGKIGLASSFILPIVGIISELSKDLRAT
jgi:hypothetical protein